MSVVSRVELLDEATNISEVLYLKFLKFKGFCGKPYIFALEGHDDVTFISTILKRISEKKYNKTAFFNCEGKSQVLNLFDVINESLELSKETIWFFIDKDFDYLRGRAEDERIWVTPAYSFENILVSKEVLESLMVGEYRCTDESGHKDIKKINFFFEEFIKSHEQNFYLINLCAFHAVRNNIKTNPYEEIITPKIFLDFPEMKIGLLHPASQNV